MPVLSFVLIGMISAVQYLGMYSQTFWTRYDGITSSSQHGILSRYNSHTTLHLLAVADDNFAQIYRPIFEKNAEYATRHGYIWHIIGTESPNCTKQHRDFFFRKHCMVAEWMETNLMENDVLFVCDSDVVPYRANLSLDSWTIYEEDVIMYERYELKLILSIMVNV